MMRRAWLLGVLFVLGCGGGGGANARLDGLYEGTLFVGGQPVVGFRLVVAQSGSAVSGTYDAGSDRGTFAANVNGRQFSGVLQSTVVPRFACNTTGAYDDQQVSGTLACTTGTGSFTAHRT